MTDISIYQAVFDYLLDSIAVKEVKEDEFFKPFFSIFRELGREQAELKNSSYGEVNGQIITKMRFKDFTIRFVFSSSGLVEAVMKVPKEIFFDLKKYAKSNFSEHRSMTWEKEMFGMMETLKVHRFRTEANFTRIIGMGYEVMIKHIS